MIDDVIGRAPELETLEGMFTLSTAPSGMPPRLLTLTGVGGSGKTRLARQFSDRIRGEFADGTIWVDLAPLSAPELVLRAILTALDVPEQPAQPPVEALVAELAPKQLSLILDNCEHLLDGIRVLGQSLLPIVPNCPFSRRAASHWAFAAKSFTPCCSCPCPGASKHKTFWTPTP